MSDDKNRAIVRRVYDALLNERNLALSDTLYAPGYVHHDRGVDGNVATMNRYLTQLFAAFPDGRYCVEEMLAADDKVITRWSWVGTHEGNLGSIAPTGKRVTTSGIEISRIADGKIVEAWGEWDMLGYLRQLGAI